MAISTDFTNSPPVVTLTGSATPATSASFTPPPMSLVIVLAAAGWSGATQAVITCSDTSSHVWANPIKATGTTGNGGTASIFTSYFATSPGPITVSLGFSGFAAGSGGRYADIITILGAAASQVGAGVGSKLGTSGLDGTFNLTTTKKNSWIFGVSDDSTNGALWTPAVGVLQDNQFNNATDNITSAGWVVTALPSILTYTIGGTWAANGSANHSTQQCAVEVMPALDLPFPPRIVNIQAIRAAYM